MSGEWLPLVWLIVIAFAIFMYVLLDGFVLGTGILFSFVGSDAERDTMMTSVAPIWDGNETWLVLGAGGLFAVIPLAYSVVLPALYLPFMVMLLGLVFRGVAFEIRFKATRSKKVWDLAFQWGSVVATFAQGVVLGFYRLAQSDIPGALEGVGFWLHCELAVVHQAGVAGGRRIRAQDDRKPSRPLAVGQT